MVGSNGFFGKNIINFFSKNNYIKKISRKNNINKLNFKNFDFIINCATDVYDESQMFKNNTAIVDKILKKILSENPNIMMIHFGSSGEYGAAEKGQKKLI